MTKRRRTEPLRISLLRALQYKGMQTSMELTLRLNPYPDKSLVQARNGVNGRLGDLKRAGHIKTAGTTPSAYHNTPALVWTITPEGAAHLEAWKSRKTQREQREENRTVREARKESAIRSLLRQAMDNGWGPGCPTEKRRAISRALREQGLPYDWIAAVFDVSHELIRQDCRGLVLRKGDVVRIAPPVVPKQGPGYVWARTREGAGAA